MSDDQFKFSDDNEQQITAIKNSVKQHADYDLRQIVAVTKRVSDKVSTGNKNEYGMDIEDWDRIPTKELINIFSEMNALNFYATPVRLNGFIESSLAEIIYQYNYDSAMTDPSLSGTVAVKQSLADLNTQDSNFSFQYRKYYTTYVTDVLRSFDAYIKRLEKIIDWRVQEERMNANKNPFISGATS